MFLTAWQREGVGAPDSCIVQGSTVYFYANNLISILVSNTYIHIYICTHALYLYITHVYTHTQIKKGESLHAAPFSFHFFLACVPRQVGDCRFNSSVQNIFKGTFKYLKILSGLFK